jgi:hypothetical protein
MGTRFFAKIIVIAIIGLMGSLTLTACQKQAGSERSASVPDATEAETEEAAEPKISDPALQKTEAMVKQVLKSVFGRARLTIYFSGEMGVGPSGGASLEYSLGRAAKAGDADQVIKLFQAKGFSLLGQSEEAEVVAWTVEDSALLISGSYGVGDSTILVVISPQTSEEEVE